MDEMQMRPSRIQVWMGQNGRGRRKAIYGGVLTTLAAVVATGCEDEVVLRQVANDVVSSGQATGATSVGGTGFPGASSSLGGASSVASSVQGPTLDTVSSSDSTASISGSGTSVGGTPNTAATNTAATNTAATNTAATNTAATNTAAGDTGGVIDDAWDASSCPPSTEPVGSGGSAGAASDDSPLVTGPGSTSTDPELLVAFLGDQGSFSGADAVLELIREEGADAAVHIGDFDYQDSPDMWDARIDRMLGPGYPYFALVGNHDTNAWSREGGYAEKIAERHARIPEMNCTGELGVMATCNFRGLHMVQSCMGVSGLGTHCAKDSPEQLEFIRNSLANHDAVFSVCLWHKNQRDMQVGGKGDEVGWGAYRECMAAGAIVATGHEHSYSRTRTLTDVGNPANQHGVVGSYPSVELAAGRNFVIVSGLGGHSIRNFHVCNHHESTWWASYYTGNRWLKNGVRQTGLAQHGATFIRFHVEGDARKARGYFKDINGVLADEFEIIVP